ncbi:MAG TPA: sulfite exporter TauE/SafE family protein [Rhizomicrobium sp.]
MSILHTIQPLYVLSGLIVGVLVGMTGVAGGSLMTPVLILLFDIHPVTAVGTDLLYASVTKTGGTLVHNYNGTVDWRVASRLAMGSVPMTALTIWLLYVLDVRGDATHVIVTKVLGVALFLTALSLIFRTSVMNIYERRVGVLDKKLVRNLTIAMGALLGLLVTISSVGAGAIGVTALMLLYPSMPTARIVGSNIAHAVPLTLLAGLGHWMIGSIDFSILGSLLVGSIPGTIAGSFVAPRVPDPALRFTLATLLIVVCARFWFWK